MKILDAHHHLWDRQQAGFDYSWQDAPELAPICRNFLPGDLKPLLDRSGIDGTILVQTQHDLRENDWALSLARSHGFIRGVVGWVDLASPDCERQVRTFAEDPLFVGIRHVIQDEPDPNFVISSPVLAGLEVLQQEDVPFDLLFREHHLPHAETVARRFPGLRLVIDHLSKPVLTNGVSREWREALVRAAACPNVYCKLSGLVTEASWSGWRVDDFRPFVEIAIDAFSPSRIMFGSDWPVCNLAASYDEVVTAARELISKLSADEQQQIMAGTGCRFYGVSLD